MEYVNCVFVNNIIYYFEQSTTGIKSKNYVFIITIINLFFKNEVSDSMTNVYFTDTMLECCMIEFNINFKYTLNVGFFL